MIVCEIRDFCLGRHQHLHPPEEHEAGLEIDHALVRELGTSTIDEAPGAVDSGGRKFPWNQDSAGFVQDVETLSKLSEMGVHCVQGTLIGESQPLARLG